MNVYDFSGGILMPSRGVIDFGALLDQIKSAIRVRKVDFIGVGDSNLLYAGHGWDEGLQFALAQHYPMYATGLVTLTENAGSGAGTGLEGTWARRNGGAAYMDHAGAPAALENHLEGGALNPHYYGYVASGDSKTAVGHGMNIGADGAIDVDANLRFDLWWGSFDSGAGSFDLSIRRGDSPYTTLTASAPVSTNTGVLGDIGKASVAIPAASRGYKLEMLSSNNGRNIVGPFFGTYQRVVNLDRSNGWSYSNMSYRGGQPLRTHAQALQSMSDAALVHYLQAVRDGQSGQAEKMFVFTVNTGLNELNEPAGSMSLGPNPAAGGSPEALVDNFEAIRLRIEGIWQAQGWDIAEVHWLFYVSHPVSDPDDAKLVSYRDAIRVHFNANVSRGQSIDLSGLATSPEMLTEGWYNSGGSDRSHLTKEGYRNLGTRLLDLA